MPRFSRSESARTNSNSALSSRDRVPTTRCPQGFQAAQMPPLVTSIRQQRKTTGRVCTQRGVIPVSVERWWMETRTTTECAMRTKWSDAKSPERVTSTRSRPILERVIGFRVWAARMCKPAISIRLPCTTMAPANTLHAWAARILQRATTIRLRQSIQVHVCCPPVATTASAARWQMAMQTTTMCAMRMKSLGASFRPRATTMLPRPMTGEGANTRRVWAA